MVISAVRYEINQRAKMVSLNREDRMTADPITIRPDDLAAQAIQMMEHNRRKPISVLPVVDPQGRMQGDFCVSMT